MQNDARLVHSLQELYTFRILITKRSRSCEAPSICFSPCGRGSKNQKFSLHFLFSSAGGVGGADKKGKYQITKVEPRHTKFFKEWRAQICMCLPPPSRAHTTIPAVFRRNYKTAGIAPSNDLTKYQF
jgi:hypothetical protein